jgi:hypothetical protein
MLNRNRNLLMEQVKSLNYIESVHNVSTLWTDFLKKGICVPFWYKPGANTRSVRKVTDFVDRHYIITGLSGGPDKGFAKKKIIFKMTRVFPGN